MGSRVNCYDPKAMDNARFELKGHDHLLTFVDTPYHATNEADALVFMTNWPEFVFLDFQKIREMMRSPVIIDGRNMLPVEKMEKLGFRFYGIGRFCGK